MEINLNKQAGFFYCRIPDKETETRGFYNYCVIKEKLKRCNLWNGDFKKIDFYHYLSRFHLLIDLLKQSGGKENYVVHNPNGKYISIRIRLKESEDK